MMSQWGSSDWGWADFRRAGGLLEHQEYLRLVENAVDPEICRRLLVSDEWGYDRHPFQPMLVRPTERALARVCADYRPTAGEEAPLMLFGQVSEYLQATEPIHRALMVYAMAAYLFASPGFGGKPLYRYWLRSKPDVDPEFKESVARLERVPVGLWHVTDVNETGVELEDWVGFGEKSAPKGPVWFPGLTLERGQFVLARVGPCRSNWIGVHGIVLPVAPPKNVVRAEVMRLLLLTRIHFRSATVKDVLRWRGHGFHRWCVEWSFAREKELPYCGLL